ncbi:MAG: adenosine kinase [Gemmatimonadota bacterium]|nr:MAG: adenosine kinase [Gemmatimonadota bacterium]
MSILVVGSVAYDTVRTPLGHVDDALGGSATYFSSAAALFAPVKIVAVVGDDFNHGELDFLRARGVDTSGIAVDAGATFRWSGSYGDEMGDATTLDTQLNVFQNFRPTIPDTHRDEKFVFLANIDPALQMAVLDQVRDPQMVICDTMNFWIHGKRAELLELLKRVDVFVLNETEAKDLTGESNPIRAAKRILTMGPSRIVVKLGEYGVLLAGDDQIYRLPAYPVEAVHDPTGAGDTFAGGFVGYMAETGDLSFEGMHRALLAGTVAASFNVEAFSLGRMREIERAQLDERCLALERIAGWAWTKRLVGQG